ncbi:MAG: hypothetical protein SOR61_09330 [Evtepia sp.]|uniref:hypothetical protein n=1 Tax=Evtepia sp. TaxID=2773933 RepID=UPI002A75F424|nr:hypothetical protein [Evtepia sp.]MDY3015354.1 hypothetical protein [Evtepia sp.]
MYPTRNVQAVIDRALSVRGGRAELLHAYIDVEPANYNRGFFSVDIRYYYRITAEAFVGGPRPAEISGLAVFDKRVILFGSEGNAKIFSSRFRPGENDVQGMRRTNLPEAVVEAVDPIVLNLRLLDPCDCVCPPPCPPPCGGACPPPCPPPCGGCCAENELTEIPACISACFDCELAFDGGCRRLYVTLGQFSMVRLERDSQLLIPMYDYCMPTRECTGKDDDCDDDPCEIFRQIRFPVGEFFPPSTLPGMEEGGCNPGSSGGASSCRSCG